MAEINPLLTLGLGILGANQPSRAPNPFLSVLGRGGINAMQMMQQQQAAATRKAQAEAAMEYQKANQERMTAKTEQERRAAELAATDRTAFGALGADADVTNPEVRRLYRSQGLDPSFGFDKKKQWLLRDGNTVYDTFQAGDSRAPKQATPPAATSQERNYRNLLRKGVSHAEAMRLSYGAGDTPSTSETERLLARRNEIETELASGTVTEPLKIGQLQQELATIQGILDKKVEPTPGKTEHDIAAKAAAAASKTTATGRAKVALEGEEEAQAAAGVMTQIMGLQNKLKKFRERGHVSGWRGALGGSEAVGYLEQEAGDLVRGTLSMLGAAPPEDIKAYRVQVGALVADLVRVLTPEQGARISDYELQRTQYVSGLEAPSASVPVLQKSLREIHKMQAFKGLRAMYKQGAGIAKNTAEQIEQASHFVDAMREQGMSDEDITEVWKSFKAYDGTLRLWIPKKDG